MELGCKPPHLGSGVEADRSCLAARATQLYAPHRGVVNAGLSDTTVALRAAPPISGDLVGRALGHRAGPRRRLSPFSPLDRLNFLVFDTYQKLKPREATESAVAVVDIDDESIRQLGQWPWSRTVLACVIDRLTAEGAAAIGLDIIFSEPDRTSPALAVAQLEGQGFQVTYGGSGAELDHDMILAKGFTRSPVIAGLVLAEGTTTPPPTPRPASPSPGTIPRPTFHPTRQRYATSQILNGRRPARRLQLPAGAGRRGPPDTADLASRQKLYRPCRSSR